ncbi:hypothetical protein AP75_13220 [Kaistella haifensis DSM 19056]|uniref:Periplasmic heavy metal sensor n=1 Tax=Kaistella haifensis DSM 19056 TaxID=1450526 RepID=A0A246B7F3_9FLAO|nr:hypothetical protein [Kaistella haifensis]OWK97064.1 hypothetical protein AP75_13220 [Kaistella haifensis DSM 19056]
MKKTLLIVMVLLFASNNSFAQEQKYDWKKMKPEQRKELIQNMSPDDRMTLLKQFRENMMVEELEVAEDEQIEFKNLFAEYQEKQNEIKSRFKPSEDYDNMSDEEAKRRLNESFEIGQQLLDNRKLYSQKFMRVIKPQQVLQMYQTEGKMRNKILDKKQDGSGKTLPQRRRP